MTTQSSHLTQHSLQVTSSTQSPSFKRSRQPRFPEPEKRPQPQNKNKNREKSSKESFPRRKNLGGALSTEQNGGHTGEELQTGACSRGAGGGPPKEPSTWATRPASGQGLREAQNTRDKRRFWKHPGHRTRHHRGFRLRASDKRGSGDRRRLRNADADGLRPT